ncbi:MAG: hypothetical protein AAB421_00930 [Patescibacteria group bacterium]
MQGLNLTSFDVSAERGFLPKADPLRHLPRRFQQWERLAEELPGLIAARSLGAKIRAMPELATGSLQGCELERAYLLLSFFASGMVWERWQDDSAAARIPKSVAAPLVAVSKAVGRPPILSYASYALNNWRRLDLKGSIALGNIVLLQHFLGGLDEEWFTLVHIDMEARAGEALVAATRAQEAALSFNTQALERCLRTMNRSLEQVYATFCRMPERCDPYIYYNRVRPFIHGWKNHPLIPEGVIYEGTEYGDAPQQFRGETGAQSSIVPVLDAVLGVTHAQGMLSEHLAEMRAYMPMPHRALIAAVEARPSIRAFVATRRELAPVFNRCAETLYAVRKKHLEYAVSYIHKQSRIHDQGANPAAVGTGGTPFMPSLAKHLEETLSVKI